MNYINIDELFSNYGLTTVIIALSVSIIDYVLEKTIFKTAPTFVKNFAPFLLTVIITVCYDCFFVYAKFTVTIESVISGLVAGLISTLISVTAKKVANGESLPSSASLLIIEGLLDGLVDDSKKTDVVEQIDLFLSAIGLDEIGDAELFEKIASIIKNNANTVLKEKDLTAIVEIIISTIKSSKDE